MPEILEEKKNLYNTVKEMALIEAKANDLDKDQRLSDKNSIYFHNLAKLAMDTISFFLCFKCKKPYYGGKKDCNRGVDHVLQPEEYVCSLCAFQGIRGNASCSKHGTEHILYKCKFCCSIALWCFSSVH